MIPPSNLDAERAVLGAIMLRNSVLSEAQAILEPSDFYSPAHRMVFSSMLELEERSAPIDPITVKAKLGDQVRRLEGGEDYLVRLLGDVHTSANIEQYARIVADRSKRRRAIEVARELARSALAEDSETEEFLAQAERSLFELAADKGAESFVSDRDAIHRALLSLEAKKAGKVVGIPTGFDELDQLLGGLPKALIVAAARPGAGKSGWALSVAKNVAFGFKAPPAPVAMFSYEMSDEENAERLLAAEGRVDLGKMRRCQLGPHDWINLTQAAAKFLDKTRDRAPILIDPSADLTIQEVAARSHRFVSEHCKDGRGLIIVDYLQLAGVKGRPQNREREISMIAQGLKAMAKKLSVPVIALSQLNRDLEKREDKRPILSDLRESGSLEQEAHIVLCIYRDEMYCRECEQKKACEKKHKGIAEVIVRKNRQGPKGTAFLAFDEITTAFRSRSF